MEASGVWAWVSGVLHKICLGYFCQGSLRPISEYGKRRDRGRTYLRPYCRRCERERSRLFDQETKRRWRKRNPDKVAVWRRRRQERLVKAPGGRFDPSRQDYQKRFDELGRRCFWCGGPFQTIDHLMPISRNGSNHPSNIVPACRVCNSSRRDKTPEEWDDRPYLRKRI